MRLLTFKKSLWVSIGCEATTWPRSVVEAKVNRVSRAYTCANHSATHLLQAALIDVLGPHVSQKVP